MFAKFSRFWIANPIITWIFIILALAGGTLSYLLVPKQYNPDISAPTYMIIMKAPGYDAKQIYDYVTKPTEAKLANLEWLDKLSSVTDKNYTAITVAFKPGLETETASVRLTNRLITQIDTKPDWVSEPIIKSVDSDDIPIYTFAITASGISDSGNLDAEKIALKKAGQDIMEKIQGIAGVSTMTLVGGEDDSMNVVVDIDKLEAKNTDLLQVYKSVKESSARFPGGDFVKDGVKNEIMVDGDLSDEEKVKNITVNTVAGSDVLLQDVAEVYRGVSDTKSNTFYTEWNSKKQAVYIAISKKKGTNSVVVVDAIKKKLSELSGSLSPSYELHTIQDEGAVASHSTSELFHELANTVIILFFILLVFLGFKDAFSSALSVPIVLALSFAFAYVTGDNINKITLFALILSLGMLVDDSIIVVENITRHFALNKDKKKPIIDIISEAVDEIGSAAFFSTITKIVAFIGLFAVQGMLGQYTGPIPKYLILSLVVSIFVAFAVNPYVSYVFAKRAEKQGKSLVAHSHAEGRVIRWYRRVMTKTLASSKIRKTIKIGFWVTLLLLFTLPQFEAVKMRLLPKSDRDQIYVWIDASRTTPYEKTEEIAEDISSYMASFTHSGSVVDEKNLAIVQDSSYFIGVAPTMDFSTATRGGPMRSGENQISVRVNLIPSDERDMTSEVFTQKFRLKLESYLAKYPGVKLRLLEDPAGPPTPSTFLIKVSGESGEKPENVEKLTKWLHTKINPIIGAQKVVDSYDDVETYRGKSVIKLDYDPISRLGLSTEQVMKSIYGIFDGASVGMLRDSEAKHPVDIYVKTPESVRDSSETLSKITFTSNTGRKVPLSEIATIENTSDDHPIKNDERLPTASIYGEIGDNSVMYPMVNLIKRFLSTEFWEWAYQVTSWNPYEFTIKEISTGKSFSLRLAGEWEMTVDSFRDLAVALGGALSLLFFLVAANFRSFRMAGVIMLSFLLGFFGLLPGFAILYFVSNIYMSATSLIGIIALSGIVIGNGIIFFDYFRQLVEGWAKPENALVDAGATRMTPIMLTSATAILGAAMIASDPVWSGLAWAFIWGLSASATLMLFVIPVFALDAWKKTSLSLTK